MCYVKPPPFLFYIISVVNDPGVGLEAYPSDEVWEESKMREDQQAEGTPDPTGPLQEPEPPGS